MASATRDSVSTYRLNQNYNRILWELWYPQNCAVIWCKESFFSLLIYQASDYFGDTWSEVLPWANAASGSVTWRLWILISFSPSSNLYISCFPLGFWICKKKTPTFGHNYFQASPFLSSSEFPSIPLFKIQISISIWIYLFNLPRCNLVLNYEFNGPFLLLLSILCI